MSIFKRRSVIDLINAQIKEAKKVLLDNQGTAEHYEALAAGNQKTLARLIGQLADETAATAPKPIKAPKTGRPDVVVTPEAPVAKTPRLASAK